MDENYREKRRYGADKIALLGLFIFALLIARFITSSRHTRPLKAGSEIVNEIKTRGLSSFLDGQSRQDFFLIKDAKGRTIGFTMDVLIDSGTDAQLNIQAAGFSYIRGRYIQEQVTFFQSDNSFEEFTWKSETAGPAGRRGTQILLGKDGIVTITAFGQNQKEQSYKLQSASIPGIFLELVLIQMLDSDLKKIIVSIINSDGTTPYSVISRVKAEDADLLRTEAEYIFNVEFRNGRRFSEQVYLDSQKQVSKILLRQERLYIFERTGMENILREFPERADYIQQKNKMLEQGRPPKNSQS